MKDPNADLLIQKRLKYDGVVLAFGVFCVAIQLVLQGDLVYFFCLVGVFVLVEGFSVAAYRKLQAGGEDYHMPSNHTLDQSTSAGFILFCMVFDFLLLISFALIFFFKAITSA